MRLPLLLAAVVVIGGCATIEEEINAVSDSLKYEFSSKANREKQDAEASKKIADLYKKRCEEWGTVKGTPEFAQCMATLYSKSNNQTAPPSNKAPLDPSTTITPNAYGPGVHMDQYGRPVTVQPAW